MKVKEIIKIIENDGWYLARIRGSHRQYKHLKKSGLVTVPGKLSDANRTWYIKQYFETSSIKNIN